MHHPWREFRSLIDWTLIWADLPGRVSGLVDFAWREVVIDRSLTQAARRCTIAHEVEHIRRGPVPADPHLARREEEAASAAAARRLIDKLGEALAWSQDRHEVAECLWVDVATLDARLRHLHPSERHYLMGRMQRVNG